MADDLTLNVNITTDDAQSNLADAVESVETLDEALAGIDETEVAPEADTSGIEDVASAADAAQSALDNIASTTVAPSVDTSGLDDVAAAAGGVDDSLGDVEEGAGGADAAMGNMVGKAVSKLPGVSEALGPMSKNLGQVVSGAAKAGEGFGKMAGQAAALVVVALLVKGISDALDDEKEKENKAFHKEQVDSFTESIKSGKGAVAGIVDELTKAGEIKFNIADGLFKGDLTDSLAKAGVSVEQYVGAFTKGQPGLDQFESSLKQTSLSGGEQAVIMITASEAADDYAKAQDNAAKFNAVFGDSAADAAKKVAADKLAKEQAKQATENIETALDQATAAYKNQSRAIQDTLDKTLALVTVNRDAADANLNARDKARAYASALDNLTQLVGTGTASQRDLEAALDGATSAASASADAQVDLKVKQDEANGVTTTAKDKQDAWNQAMLTAAGTATGAAKQAIIDYVTEANGIPTNIATEITAAVAAGDLAKANQLLADASKPRSASITADADQAALDNVNRKLDDIAKERVAKFGVSTGGGSKAFASGTDNLPAGVNLFGENGPELGITDQTGRTRILSNSATNRALNDLGGAYVDNSTTIINLPPAVSPATLAAAQRRTTRRRLT